MKKQKVIENPIAKIEMLISCYEPDLSKEVKLLAEEVELFRSSLFKFYAETLSSEDQKISPERFEALLKLPFETSVRLSKELVSLLQARIHDTLG
ncbi:MAG: hypothetical protein C0401_11275 [Anaerolinea sp.]|nr:hypothetical protein [Anaerolinea sp.]